MNIYIKKFLTTFVLAFAMFFTTAPVLATYAEENDTHSTNQIEENTDLGAENGAESGNLPEDEETPNDDELPEESPEDGADVLPNEPTEETPSEPELPDESTDLDNNEGAEEPEDVTPPENTEEPGEEQPEQDTGFNIEELASNFTKYLKDKYGEDFDFYYNQIIEQWGSIEAYLLQFGYDYIPEDAQEGYFGFIGWLHEYSVVWVPVVAMVVVIAVAIFGKKAFNKIVDAVTKSKVEPLIAELNKQSKALAALVDANKTLLPKNDKYATEAEELDKAKKELIE